MSEQEWPAFRPEFKGHIGSTSGNEPNDKSNAKRMAELYGKVFRYLEDGDKWMVWKGTHWGQTKQIIRRAMHDMSEYMEIVEVPGYAPLNAPEFPSGWDVCNHNGHPYKTLLGRYGALYNAPEQTFGWAAKNPRNAEFMGNRLASENEDGDFQAALKWAEKSKDSARITAAIREAASREEFEAGIEDFDTVPNTFTVLNGQINTVTCEPEAHRLEDLNTRLCPLDYNPEAECPNWLRYMETSQPDPETRKHIQKLIGYAISGDGNQKVITFMFSKVGDTGRSLFETVIDKVLGPDYSLPLAPGTLERRKFDEGGRDPDREQIRGKRFAHTSELDPNVPLDERFLKRISGRDAANTRGNYSREGNKAWEPECLLVIATNHLIRLQDEAIWNRVEVVPWTQSFPKGHKLRDEDLQDKILGNEAKGFPGEMEGVFAWAMEGLRLYRKEGLTPPPEVELATLEYKSDGDDVQKWLAYASAEGDLLMGDERYDKATPLNRMFKAWARDNGIRNPLGLQKFNARMEELGYERRKVTAGPEKNHERTFGLSINPASDAYGKFNLINKESD